MSQSVTLHPVVCLFFYSKRYCDFRSNVKLLQLTNCCRELNTNIFSHFQKALKSGTNNCKNMNKRIYISIYVTVTEYSDHIDLFMNCIMACLD